MSAISKGLVVLSVFVLSASAVSADIGGVGSPVIPSNGGTMLQNNPVVEMGGGVQIGGAPQKKVPADAAATAQPGAVAPATAATGSSSAAMEGRVIFSQEFSQHRVNYDSELKQAIQNSEFESPRTHEYTVISTVPSNLNKKDQGSNLVAVYQSNIADVVTKIGSYGVATDKIHVANEVSDDSKEQQISVSVK